MARAEDEEFCGDYLLVDAKEATLFDIACILVCSTSFLKRRKFYEERCEHPKSICESLRQRRLLFASMVAQKVLFIFRKPLAWLGSFIETWLNLLSSNGGLFGLLIHSIKGKVVNPRLLPENFMSIVGQLDKRLNLDESIRKGDGRYYASLSMLASKLAYENEAFVEAAVRDHLKMDFIAFYDFWNDYQNKFTTQAIMFQDATSDSDLIVVAFRGTSPFAAEDWMTDVDISWYELNDTYNSEPIGRIHGGFMKALGLQKIKGWPIELKPPLNPNEERPFAYYTIREKLKEILEKNKDAKFMVTGHSLGAALAILFVGVLGLHDEKWLLERLDGVYTYGQPRVGDVCFGSYMMKMINDHGVRYFRFVYSSDIVPRLPYDNKNMFFKHFGETLYYNSFYKGKVRHEEPNKNYFSLVWVIPKYLNAFWEFIRSFILPYWKGKEYKEGYVERLFRIVGLIIPGLSAHSPKDYVDVTWLGTDLVPTMTNEEHVGKND